MKPSLEQFVARLPRLARDADEAGMLLSDEAAAHAYLAAATGSRPGEPPRYAALVPRRIRVLSPNDTPAISGAELALGPVAMVLIFRLDLYRVTLELVDGTRVPVPTTEAVVAQLLAQGGLAIGLVASMLRLSCAPALDVDQVRDLLKAAGQSERYQPLMELLDVA